MLNVNVMSMKVDCCSFLMRFQVQYSIFFQFSIVVDLDIFYSSKFCCSLIAVYLLCNLNHSFDTVYSCNV